MTAKGTTRPTKQTTLQEPSILKNSSDILFLMDATLTNPNGDPYENIPRRCRTEKGDLGEITGVCLGQTIRGYLKKVIENGSALCIFVDREGDVLSAGEAFSKFAEEGKEIAEQNDKSKYLVDKFLQKYIDVRLFGSLVTIQEKAEEKLKNLGVEFRQNSIQYTGPVQLGAVGQTVHPIAVQKIPITSAFRSKEGKEGEKEQEQGTRGEKWVVNYGLYQFTPVIDATLAGQTRMTERDKDLFVEALWCGIKTRVSGSKANQLPLLYLEVVYNDGIKGRIGRLSDFVVYEPAKEPQSIRDVKISTTKLVEVLAQHKNVIKQVRVIEDEDRLNLKVADQLKQRQKELTIEEGDSLTGKFNDASQSPSSGDTAK
jgi:CRISPR-associated protein Csh2